MNRHEPSLASPSQKAGVRGEAVRLIAGFTERNAVLLFLASLVSIFCLLSVANAQPTNLPQPSPYSHWTKGPPADANYFPIGVWLQSPDKAARYKAAGINLYVALWRGPTDEQLALLQKAGMRLICSQNQAGLKNLDNPTIIGWMHG